MLRRGAAERVDMHLGSLATPAASRVAPGFAARLGRAVRTALRMLPALLPVLLFVPFVLAPPINHDVAAVLSFSERWLAGEHLYSDLIDVNPPLIYVLNLLPAAIAAATGLDAVIALQGCLVAFGLFVWWLAVRTRDRAAEGP